MSEIPQDILDAANEKYDTPKGSYGSHRSEQKDAYIAGRLDERNTHKSDAVDFIHWLNLADYLGYDINDLYTQFHNEKNKKH